MTTKETILNQQAINRNLYAKENIMTNKDIVLIALNKYLIELSAKNEIHNFDIIEKTENLINYIKQ